VCFVRAPHVKALLHLWRVHHAQLCSPAHGTWLTAQRHKASRALAATQSRAPGSPQRATGRRPGTAAPPMAARRALLSACRAALLGPPACEPAAEAWLGAGRGLGGSLRSCVRGVKRQANEVRPAATPAIFLRLRRVLVCAARCALADGPSGCAAQVRPGNIIESDGRLCEVVKFTHAHGHGRQLGNVQARARPRAAAAAAQATARSSPRRNCRSRSGLG